MIAIRADALIFPTFCVWDRGSKRYKFVHGKLLEPIKTGDIKQDIIETTAAYTAEIEKIIRQYSDQWMWIHRRWKTRRPGEPDIYSLDDLADEKAWDEAFARTQKELAALGDEALAEHDAGRTRPLE